MNKQLKIWIVLCFLKMKLELCMMNWWRLCQKTSGDEYCALSDDCLAIIIMKLLCVTFGQISSCFKKSQSK